ncbi:uncharacterized protein LOC119670164 [Teleopsis dalmanni]|uniref:uncharacterized protein LOC119670164 n=1 Tax=Teleopsis dalmanni TaxID=139649 RepID=UPI0018CCDB83|nr:uncharacterized protein LOC119670164 [Teleopsis dalmanni]
MDFRNLCQKIDMDSIKAKLPAMPAIPAISQIKIPKSMSKLKSRKIFRTSREDVTKDTPSKQMQSTDQQQMPPSIPPSDFIDHTPRRISTISSLMHQDSNENRYTYRSACSVDDDYPSPTQFNQRFSRPISPIQTPAYAPETIQRTTDVASSTTSVKMTFTEKLQKGYKDISEFRLKHIFAKKTVIRKDTIEVNHYVQRYDEERQLEQQEEELRDQSISDNYRFNFKISRQNTGHSNSISSNDSTASESKKKAQQKSKSVGEQSGDESGMEVTPPIRQAGIAATRFAKVRNPPLSLSMSEESISSTKYVHAENVYSSNSPITKPTPPISEKTLYDVAENEPRNQEHRKYMRRAASIDSTPDESGTESPSATASGGTNIITRLKSYGKSKNPKENVTKAPVTPQQSLEKTDKTNGSENTFTNIKQNLKKFSKSIKRQQTTTENPENEETTNKEKKEGTKTVQFSLRRFKTQDVSADDTENEYPKQEEEKSPKRQTITSKLESWKNSFKKSGESGAQSDTESNSKRQRQRRKGTVVKKFKNARLRKTPTSDYGETDDEGSGATSGKSRAVTNLQEKFEYAKEKTLKKVNEQMQNIKFFHKSQDQTDKDSNKKNSKKNKNENETVSNMEPKIARRGYDDDYQYRSEQEDLDESEEEITTQKTRTAWTTRSVLSDSMESELDAEFPRVLIHQDNSDAFESTLIIAVTRPAVASPTPKIAEISNEEKIEPKALEWVSNEEIISGLKNITPSSKRRMSADAVVPRPRKHTRQLSVDSNSDSDSWIPEAVRAKQQNRSQESLRSASGAGLNVISEKDEAWKVQATVRDEKLYKTKSIDIFERNVKQGGLVTAFEDFDDELKNEPVVKIGANNLDSSEKDSSEEPDDDNSSRVTKILADKKSVQMPVTKEVKANPEQKILISNSRESLIANFDENEDMEFDVDDNDRPPSAAPSPPPIISLPPPPSISPPPPPIPQRMPSIRMSKITKDTNEVVPPLPLTKPPEPLTAQPPIIPERTVSMARIAKPLVKTSSLRLTYDEQVNPNDVGKVNKLISRFEHKPKTRERNKIVTKQLIHGDSEYYSDEEEEMEEVIISDVQQQINTMVFNTYDEVNKNILLDNDTTPTPTPTPTNKTKIHKKSETETCTQNSVPTKRMAPKPELTTQKSNKIIPTVITTHDDEQNIIIDNRMDLKLPTISISVDRNYNYSQPSSEYGSPLEYPSSLIGSTETTPTPDRRQEIRVVSRTSRRSMARDDEKFHSFDSDEENSYYSLSSSGSSRYIVDI